MAIGEARVLTGPLPAVRRLAVVFNRGNLMLTVVRRPMAGATPAEPERFGQFIVLATAGVVAYSVALPIIRLYSILADPIDLGLANYAIPAFVCYLPIMIWVVLAAARDEHPRGRRLALAAMAVVIFSVMPVVGVGWVGMLYGTAALALLTFRQPWSLILFALLVVAPAPLTIALGHGEFALYFTVGMLLTSVPLAVGIWLIRTARQLQAARLGLAQQAIARERLRIDGQLRTTVGAALEAITSDGEEARSLAATNPAASARVLSDVAGFSRRTLAEVRRMLTQYREVSLRAELDTAATLLSAAGIRTRLELPPGPMPTTADDRDRTQLQHDIAHLLATSAPISVVITVSRQGDAVRLGLKVEPDPTATEVAVR